MTNWKRIALSRTKPLTSRHHHIVSVEEVPVGGLGGSIDNGRRLRRGSTVVGGGPVDSRLNSADVLESADKQQE